MRYLAMLGTLAACHGSGGGPIGATDVDSGSANDAGVAPDAAPAPDSGLASDAGDGCAVASTGGWSGMARAYGMGAGESLSYRADVIFTLASTDACVDRYVPSGTTTDGYDGPCSYAPTTHTIAASDGALLIDRTTSPARFTLNGSSAWSATLTCDSNPPEPATAGGSWAAAWGIVAGDVIDGVADPSWQGGGMNAEWHLVRADASLPPPSGCIEPATDHWSFSGEASGGAIANVTFSRTGTDGCIDHFTAAGTAREAPQDGCTFDPATVPITDGEMTVDRGTNPPTYRISGERFWNGTRTCVDGSGGPAYFGGVWAHDSGAYQGDHAAGGTSASDPGLEWTLSR